MKLRAVFGIALVAGLCACQAASKPVDEKAPPVDVKDISCAFKHAETDAASLKQLPEPVRDYIKIKIGEMADRGAFYNNTDVVLKPAPFDRFIRGGRINGSGDKYFFWFEHGGIAYWKQIVVLSKTAGGKAALYAEKHAAFGSDLCAQTDALVAGPNQVP